MPDVFHALIIEDDLDIARLVALQVEALQGSCHHVSRLGDAQAYAKRHGIDLLILDLSLPDGDGLSFCRNFRQQDEITPILMLTARADEVDRVVGLELGADDYLSKPFGLAELKARIKALIRRSKQTHEKSSKKVVLGQLQMDPKQHQAWLFQQELHLTAKEFELLYFLARHPNDVFSRLDLLDQVWGIEHAGYEHTVNSHLNRLRNKIEKDPANPSILETVWGVGYKLNALALVATLSESKT